MEVEGGVSESEWAEGQKDRPEGQESIECDMDADTRADVDGGTSKDHEELAVSILPVKARRDAFI